MAPKIALQLYTLRSFTKNDFEGVARKVAAMGYAGVETAGFEGSNPAAAKKLFAELGLEVVGAHAPMPLGDLKNQVIDTALLLGCKYLVVPHIGPADVKDMDAVKNLCNRLNQSQAIANANSMTLSIHNHWWEYARMDGQLIADIMIGLLDPAVLFELDTYWIKVAGTDIAAIRDAGGDDTEWWIMEADQVAGDAIVEVQKSYQFMKGLLK
jgi:sugar phosphate isomerase/epimerase